NVNKLLRKSIGSAVEIDRKVDRDRDRGLVMSSSCSNKLGDLSSGNSIWFRNRKESKNEVSKLILEFKTSCSGALWMLARGKSFGGASDKAREMRSVRRIGTERVFSSGGWGVWLSCNWFDWMMKRSIER
nr:hypothetical protein [Tanacetum cinerariifolium]